MPRPSEIQTIIEQAVAEALQGALPGLRADIVRRATEQLQAIGGSEGSPTVQLEGALASIQEASSQGEILRHLLEGSAHFAGRVALFVTKGGAINFWQGLGFEDNESLKSMSLNGSSGLTAQAMQMRLPVRGSTADFDPAFLSSAGQPTGDACVVLPLVVKEKVAALIYADRGMAAGGMLEGSALSVLTRCAALWLELVALRKAGSAPAEEPQAAAAAAAATVASPVAAPAPAVPASGTTEDSDLHRKAKRFAKLLVEEIKLYNQPKVAEGRQYGDLYERLKEDIEKSRATYDKRYGESAVASANYFTEELVRILADNDITLMGASFPR